MAERSAGSLENTRPLRDLTQPGVARKVLEAATSRLDGKRAAPDTVRKHRMLLANAMDYAVELELLDKNPIKALKWRAPPPPRRVRSTGAASSTTARPAPCSRPSRSQEPSGPRLVAFFALMYYSALRPEEAVNLDRDHIALPPASQNRGWGELHLTSAAPHAGRHWTNDGSLRETRALKHRVEGESRTVPIPPQLVVILRDHLAQFPDGPDGRLFYGVRSESLPSTTYMQAWRQARQTALTPSRAKVPTRPPALRPAPCLRVDLAQRRRRPPHRSPHGPGTVSTCSQDLRQDHRGTGSDRQEANRRRPRSRAWTTTTSEPRHLIDLNAGTPTSPKLGHVLGTDTRRKPVSAGHSRTMQKRPRPSVSAGQSPF